MAFLMELLLSNSSQSRRPSSVALVGHSRLVCVAKSVPTPAALLITLMAESLSRIHLVKIPDQALF